MLLLLIATAPTAPQKINIIIDSGTITPIPNKKIVIATGATAPYSTKKIVVIIVIIDTGDTAPMPLPLFKSP